MNNKFVLFLFTIALTLAYFAGVYFPFISIPEIEEGKINQIEFNTMLLRGLASLATFAAVFVALFKEEIRSIWKNVKLSVMIPVNPIQESLYKENVNSGDSNKEFITANRYSGKVHIINKGTIPVLNAELYLEKIEYFKNKSAQPKEIEVSGKALKWDKEEETKSLIPSNGQKTCELIFIEASSKESLPGGEPISNKPSMEIGETDIQEEFHNGNIIAHFAIHSISCKCKKFKLSIEWDGIWHTRLTEMSDSLTLKLV